jgi:O-antigen/teichoic acid export membrane protein
MRRKFATNLIFLVTANLLVKPFWIFGVDRVVQNKVGPEVFGTYFAAFNYSFLLSIILDFGINNFNTRAISRDNKRVGEYLANLMSVKFVLSILYFGLTALMALATGYDAEQMHLLLFLAINQILLSAVLYFRSNIAALQLFKTDSVISILDRLLAIIFCSLLIWLPAFKNTFSIMWFIYAQTAALLITAIIAFAVIAGRAQIKIKRWKLKFTRTILLKSAPFAMLALLMGIYYRIDAVMIERMLPNGKQEAGIYAASFRMLDAVNQFGYLFATLLLPLFAAMIRRNENMKHLVKFSSELMFVVAAIAAINCYFFRNEIMHLLYPNSTAYWSRIFGWLMLNFIPISSIYIFGTLLTANGSLKILNTIAVSGAVLNVVLNIFLIPRYGALGATLATLVTQIAAAAAHIIAAYREFDFSYNLKDLLKVSVFILACLVVSFVIKMAPFSWIINFAMALGASGVFSIIVNLVPVSDVLKLLRAKASS